MKLLIEGKEYENKKNTWQNAMCNRLIESEIKNYFM